MQVNCCRISGRSVPAQALACELYKVAGIRAVEIGSFLLGRDAKPVNDCHARLNCCIQPFRRATYTQTHMDLILKPLNM
ncbi:hypothetical protein ACNKHM_12610 [Shigella sonnei]